MKNQNEFFDMLLKGMAEAEARQKHDLSSTTATTNLMHGPAGIFGYPGIEQDVFATRVKPRGLMSVLPSQGAIDENPIVAYLTGFRDDDSTDEKDGVCDTPISAGEIKNCLQGALFGRVERKTDVIEFNATGRRTNRGEFLDLRLVNDPLLESSFALPGSIPQAGMDALAREVLARWMTMGVSFERKLGPLMYTGTPANNSTNGGYKEFHGLETLVGTGKVDIISGNTCPALDSDVRDFNYLDAAANAVTLVETLTDMWRYVNDIASRTGLDPTTWTFVMRRNLFNEIADVWPCAYGTYRCTVDNVADSTIARVMVDGMAQRGMADDIRNGLYLLIDGVRVPVLIDDFIPEETDTTSANVDAGEFASDIYLIPLQVRGGIVSTYLEYFDFSKGVMQEIMTGKLGNEYWTDGGRFLWTYARTAWCAEWWAKIEPRLRLLTPHLAGRLQNVLYSPLKHYREDEPDSDYFFDGGNYERSSAPYDATDFPSRL